MHIFFLFFLHSKARGSFKKSTLNELPLLWYKSEKKYIKYFSRKTLREFVVTLYISWTADPSRKQNTRQKFHWKISIGKKIKIVYVPKEYIWCGIKQFVRFGVTLNWARTNIAIKCFIENVWKTKRNRNNTTTNFI